MRQTFARNVPDFPNDHAESLVDSKAYPELFQLCKDLDTKLFNSTLLSQFGEPAINPIYIQFIDRPRKITPARIVTTNVDLCLEQQLGPIDVIGRTDVERCCGRILADTPFVAKSHGSIFDRFRRLHLK
jgi:hypothetical protein